MQKSPVLAGLFQDCERLALEGDRPRLPLGNWRRRARFTDAPLNRILPTCAGLSGPSGIDWQRWVGRDLEVGAVMVAVISIPIEGVFTHPKDDLQRAFIAVDVREAKVGLMK